MAPAKVVIVYNWREHKSTPAITAIANFLGKPVPISSCMLPEILPSTPNKSLDPSILEWTLGPDQSVATNSFTAKIHFAKTVKVASPASAFASYIVNKQNFPVSNELYGILSWYVKISGCNGKKQYSEPREAYIYFRLPPDTTPLWVKAVIAIQKLCLLCLPVIVAAFIQVTPPLHTINRRKMD